MDDPITITATLPDGVDVEQVVDQLYGVVEDVVIAADGLTLYVDIERGRYEALLEEIQDLRDRLPVHEGEGAAIPAAEAWRQLGLEPGGGLMEIRKFDELAVKARARPGADERIAREKDLTCWEMALFAANERRGDPEFAGRLRRLLDDYPEVARLLRGNSGS